MNNNTMNSGNADLMIYAQGLHPQMEIAPCDLQASGRHALPPGFEIQIDPAHDEWIRLFGPNDTGTRVRTLTQYGGRFLIRGIDLLRALATVLRTGEPTWERSLDTQANYWRNLLATAAPFTIPAPAPMNRSEMERHIDTCQRCKPVAVAFGKAVDSGASITTDAHVTALIDKAHADPAAAVAHYLAIADGRNSLFTTSGPAPTAPTRIKRTTHPITVTQEA